MSKRTYRFDEATQCFVLLDAEGMSYADRIAVEEELERKKREETEAAVRGGYL